MREEPLVDPRSIDPRELDRIRRHAGIVRSLLEEAGIDASDPDFAEMLNNEVDTRTAIVGWTRLAREREAMAAGLKGLIGELQERMKRLLSVAEAFSDNAEVLFLETGWKDAIREPDFTLSRSRAPGKVSGDLDPETLPDEFVKVERSPKLKEIAAFLKDGGEIRGVYLGNGREYMRVTKR